MILNALASAGLWFVFFRSLQSIAYIAMWCAILLVMNIASVAAIRGSAVRLSPEQFPDLHARVAELARRLGLRRTPDVFLMQQDGALNAFATRFMRMHMVVLLSDLLEACGDNIAARDMIIGHELGHIRRPFARPMAADARLVRALSRIGLVTGARTHLRSIRLRRGGRP